MEFHGILHGIPWNSGTAKWNITKFHGISMEYSLEFHGTLVPPNVLSICSMEFYGTLRLSFYSILCYPTPAWDIPWNSMELWSRQIKNHRVPWDSMELPFQMTQEFHGIPWNIPWNSMELWCRQMKYHLVPWNSMGLWDCHLIQYHVTPDLHGIFHGIPWNSGVAK